MNIRRFTIGDWVVVSAVTEFHTLNGSRTSTRTKFDYGKLGKITGIGKRYEGTLGEGFRDWETGTIESPEFTQNKQVMGWLVRFGMSNKEQFVLDSDVVPSFAPGKGEGLHIEGESKIPYQRGQYLWKKRDRDVMRDNMKTAVRDSKGRWVKHEIAHKVSGIKEKANG